MLTFSDYMHVDEAKNIEKTTIEIYQKQGYNILNIAKAGAIGGGHLKWTFEKCKEEALKYKTRKEFYKNNNSAYNSARKNNWLEEVCNHMRKASSHKPGYWTFEKCKEEVKGCKSRNEIYKNNPGAYFAMFKNDWLNTICSHLKTKKANKYWTKENCKIEALKYNSKKEFAKNCSGAYGATLSNGWTEFVCSHMKKNKI